MTDDSPLVTQIAGFLDANYPCTCGDEDCAGGYWEAVEIVDMVRRFIAANGADAV